MAELDGLQRFSEQISRGQRLRHVIEEARTVLAKKLSSH
jgi:hypothetical protein